MNSRRPHLMLVPDGSRVTVSRTPALIDKDCEGCGKKLPSGSRTDKTYCSDACRQAAYRRRKKEAA